MLWDNMTAFASCAQGVQQPHKLTSVQTEVARRWALASMQNGASSLLGSQCATACGQITCLTLMEEDQPDLAAITFPTWVFLALEGSRRAGASSCSV